eukprot:5816552-Prymnesium_polylepis.1
MNAPYNRIVPALLIGVPDRFPPVADRAPNDLSVGTERSLEVAKVEPIRRDLAQSALPVIAVSSDREH